jgi:lipopolysaccharide assembly outer membrane protein LptD (OstA)
MTVVVGLLGGLIGGLLAGVAASAAATETRTDAPATGQMLPGIRTMRQDRLERIGASHYRATGAVEIELAAEPTSLSADQVDYFVDTKRLVATGHVVFISGDGRISAERGEFDVGARTGTFFVAFGSTRVRDPADPSLFGPGTPTAYFYGRTIEKLGPDRYRVTTGGFTTCVQPTPRWELVASSVTLTLDKRAVVRHAVLRVKDVPLAYLPAMYFPINREDRATGMLLPVYGSSSLRGHSISNAFFWAIDRSQDLTVYHDWYSKTGSGFGSEYRYVSAPGSQGALRAYRLGETTLSTSTGLTSETTSTEVRGSLVQALPRGFRLRGGIDYFTNLSVQQQYHVDVYDASLRTRSWQGQISGPLGRGNSLSATFARSEVFYGTDQSQTIGGAPRLQFTRALTRLGRAPVYVSLSSEYAQLAYTRSTADAVYDQGLARVDVTPTVQIPLTAWPFLSARTSIAWRNTFWSESLDPASSLQNVDDSVSRHLLDFQTTLTGPIVARVWNTPDNGYAERFKHVIEPTVSIQRTTAFDDYDKVVKIEAGDSLYGGTTRVTYGVTNRLFARRRAGGVGGGAGSTGAGGQELLTVQLQQTWYSNPLASTVDGSYTGAFTGRAQSSYSPIAMTTRVSPTRAVGATTRIEYNAQTGVFEALSAAGMVNLPQWVTSNVGWSRQMYAATTTSTLSSSNFFNTETTVRAWGGKMGGRYALNLNLADGTLVQQRIGGFYHAQCCGVSLEYQAWNYGTATSLAVPKDRRVSLSFTLAGVGSFSNVLGAFGIGQGATGSP